MYQVRRCPSPFPSPPLAGERAADVQLHDLCLRRSSQYILRHRRSATSSARSLPTLNRSHRHGCRIGRIPRPTPWGGNNAALSGDTYVSGKRPAWRSYRDHVHDCPSPALISSGMPWTAEKRAEQSSDWVCCQTHISTSSTLDKASLRRFTSAIFAPAVMKRCSPTCRPLMSSLPLNLLPAKPGGIRMGHSRGLGELLFC